MKAKPTVLCCWILAIHKNRVIDDRRRWLRAQVCLVLKVRVGSISYPILPARSGAEPKGT